METKGLLFIPDISGFTRFVTESEINHSRLIIQELLELLINANEIGLEVSEIEGDAILFYKFGEVPTLEDLFRQVKKMFCEFHENLVVYDQRKYCQCKACTSAADLSLKVITHYGEFTEYNVRNFIKLIGKDVIVAHQLLKNDIEQHEYWLVTRQLLHDQLPEDLAGWMKWDDSVKKTEAGEIHFHYTPLSQLKKGIADTRLPRIDLSGKKKIYSASREYETDIITLFHASGAFECRHRWWEGVKKIEVLNHFLPRVGMRSKWTLENGETVFYSSSYSYTDTRIEFSETDEKDNWVYYYTLVYKDAKRTELTIDVYQTGNWIKQLLNDLSGHQKMHLRIQKSLDNLVPLLQEIDNYVF